MEQADESTDSSSGKHQRHCLVRPDSGVDQVYLAHGHLSTSVLPGSQELQDTPNQGAQPQRHRPGPIQVQHQPVALDGQLYVPVESEPFGQHAQSQRQNGRTDTRYVV